MPAKNAIKVYAPESYYHIYNRGVNKRVIFKDQQDYSVFLSYLKTYLLPKDTDQLNLKIKNRDTPFADKYQANKLLVLNNFSDKIDLLAYCLMPNHFHLLIKQQGQSDMEHLMRSLISRYTTYFNKRYHRLGPLFQGRYKAVLIESDAQLLHLTRYIHRNPFVLQRTVLSKKDSPLFNQPSSYPNYLGKINQQWVKPDFILQNFSGTGFNSYQAFVESEDNDLEVETVTLLDRIVSDAKPLQH